MSNIPTGGEKAAATIAKNYLKQFKDWQLISLRMADNGPRVTDQERLEHRTALSEMEVRQQIITAVSEIDQSSGIILDQRFIKRHRTKQTLEELAANHYQITEGNFNNRQRKALLMAYKFMHQLGMIK